MDEKEKTQFFKQQAKSEGGKRWLEIFSEIVEKLYNSRGKSIDQVAIDQRAAEVIENEVIKTLLISNQPLRPQQNREYI